MKTLLVLAFRNLFRNRRRTLMTLVVVVGGVTALLLAGGFFSFMFWGLREMTIRSGLGHIQIYNAEYFQRDETRVLANGLENYRDLAALATKTPHVLGTAPRIEFYGMISNGMKSGTFMATAVDPTAERRMGFEPRILRGRKLSESQTGGNEALLGSGLAHSMGAEPGSTLTVLAITADGALNGIDIDVVGILTTGFKEMDDRALQLTLPAAQHLLQSGRVTKLIVGLDDTENTDSAYAALTSRLGGHGPIALKKWVELATYYRQVRLMFSGMLVFLGIIVFFMVVMSSANTLMMAMFERTREIGTMLAMGTPRAWVLLLFLLEGILTGALGAGAGVLAGSGLGVLLNHAHLQMPPPPGNLNGFDFQVRFVPELMIAAALLVVVTLAVASLAPAIRASRLRIVEALAHV